MDGWRGTAKWALIGIQIVGWLALAVITGLALQQVVEGAIPLPSQWPAPVNLDSDACEPPAFNEYCEETPPEHLLFGFGGLSLALPALIAIGLALWIYKGPYQARRAVRWLVVVGLGYLAWGFIHALYVAGQIVFLGNRWIPVNLVWLRIAFGEVLAALLVIGVIIIWNFSLIPAEREWWRRRERDYPLRYGLLTQPEAFGNPEYLWIYRDERRLPRAKRWRYGKWQDVSLQDSQEIEEMIAHGIAMSWEDLRGVTQPKS